MDDYRRPPLISSASTPQMAVNGGGGYPPPPLPMPGSMMHFAEGEDFVDDGYGYRPPLPMSVVQHQQHQQQQQQLDPYRHRHPFPHPPPEALYQAKTTYVPKQPSAVVPVSGSSTSSSPRSSNGIGYAYPVLAPNSVATSSATPASSTTRHSRSMGNVPNYTPYHAQPPLRASTTVGTGNGHQYSKSYSHPTRTAIGYREYEALNGHYRDSYPPLLAGHNSQQQQSPYQIHQLSLLQQQQQRQQEQQQLQQQHQQQQHQQFIYQQPHYPSQQQQQQQGQQRPLYIGHHQNQVPYRGYYSQPAVTFPTLPVPVPSANEAIQLLQRQKQPSPPSQQQQLQQQSQQLQQQSQFQETQNAVSAGSVPIPVANRRVSTVSLSARDLLPTARATPPEISRSKSDKGPHFHPQNQQQQDKKFEQPPTQSPISVQGTSTSSSDMVLDHSMAVYNPRQRTYYSTFNNGGSTTVSPSSSITVTNNRNPSNIDSEPISRPVSRGVTFAGERSGIVAPVAIHSLTPLHLSTFSAPATERKSQDDHVQYTNLNRSGSDSVGMNGGGGGSGQSGGLYRHQNNSVPNISHQNLSMTPIPSPETKRPLPYSRQVTMARIPTTEEILPIPGKMTSKTGKAKIQLTFDRPFYNAGSEMTGRLEVQCSSARSVMLADIRVELIGYEAISKDHFVPKIFHKTILTLQDDHHPSQAVQEMIDADKEGYWMARKGRTVFPFRIDLQDSLPNSYDCKLGQVRYIASAIAQTRVNFRKELLTHSREVSIYETWTTDDITEARRKSVKADTSKRLFMGGEGSLEMYAELTRTMVSSGGIVYVNVGVKNLTKKKIVGVKMSLWRHVAAANMTGYGPGSGGTLNLHAAAAAAQAASQAAVAGGSAAASTSTFVAVSKEQDSFKSYSDIVYKGDDHSFDSDDPRMVVLPVYIPTGVYSLRHTGYLHVQFFIQISLMASMSRSLAVDLPIYITHPSSWSDPPPRIPKDYAFPLHEDEPVKKYKKGVFQKKKEKPLMLNNTSTSQSGVSNSTAVVANAVGHTCVLSLSRTGTPPSRTRSGQGSSIANGNSSTLVSPRILQSDLQMTPLNRSPRTVDSQGRKVPTKDPDSPTSVLDFSQAGSLFVVNPDRGHSFSSESTTTAHDQDHHNNDQERKSEEVGGEFETRDDIIPSVFNDNSQKVFKLDNDAGSVHSEISLHSEMDALRISQSTPPLLLRKSHRSQSVPGDCIIPHITFSGHDEHDEGNATGITPSEPLRHHVQHGSTAPVVSSGVMAKDKEKGKSKRMGLLKTLAKLSISIPSAAASSFKSASSGKALRRTNSSQSNSELPVSDHSSRVETPLPTPGDLKSNSGSSSRNSSFQRSSGSNSATKMDELGTIMSQSPVDSGSERSSPIDGKGQHQQFYPHHRAQHSSPLSTAPPVNAFTGYNQQSFESDEDSKQGSRSQKPTSNGQDIYSRTWTSPPPPASVPRMIDDHRDTQLQKRPVRQEQSEQYPLQIQQQRQQQHLETEKQYQHLYQHHIQQQHSSQPHEYTHVANPHDLDARLKRLSRDQGTNTAEFQEHQYQYPHLQHQYSHQEDHSSYYEGRRLQVSNIGDDSNQKSEYYDMYSPVSGHASSDDGRYSSNGTGSRDSETIAHTDGQYYHHQQRHSEHVHDYHRQRHRQHPYEHVENQHHGHPPQDHRLLSPYHSPVRSTSGHRYHHHPHQQAPRPHPYSPQIPYESYPHPSTPPNNHNDNSLQHQLQLHPQIASTAYPPRPLAIHTTSDSTSSSPSTPASVNTLSRQSSPAVSPRNVSYPTSPYASSPLANKVFTFPPVLKPLVVEKKEETQESNPDITDSKASIVLLPNEKTHSGDDNKDGKEKKVKKVNENEKDKQNDTTTTTTSTATITNSIAAKTLTGNNQSVDQKLQNEKESVVQNHTSPLVLSQPLPSLDS